MSDIRINPIILKLLNNRGVCDEADVLEFLSNSPKLTYDPFLMKGMSEGTELLKKHLDKGSNICIYGDYDTDGVTSVTVMMTALGKLTDRLSYYIPSRFGEGYGLNKEAIKSIYDAGTDLIITVDCGSVSYEEVNYAKQLGLDIIVTDHHTITDRQAECILINPKQPGETYPFDGLAGVGVAFKFVQALTRAGMLSKEIIGEILDLVAIGTIGDIVPLVDENRTIVKFGIRELSKGKRKGLRMLMESVSLRPEKVNSINIAFVIVPHINAGGRLKDASLGVKLLLEDESLAQRGISLGAKCEKQAKTELVKCLIECNKERKAIQQDIYEKCSELVDADNIPDALILYAGEAHEGITGIVAGKIKDLFYRPTMIITDVNSEESGKMLKGTGRSIEGVDLYEMLKGCESLFTKFGGHKGACGFSLPAENLEAMRQHVAAHMKKLVAEDGELLIRKSPAEMVLKTDDLSFELAEQLECLAPFGAANPAPIFEFDDVVPENVFFMGAAKTHAKFYVDGTECVLFGRAKEFEEILKEGCHIDIAAMLEISEWNGQRKLQLNIQAMQKAEKYKTSLAE